MKRVLCAALCLVAVLVCGCRENTQPVAEGEQSAAESVLPTASEDVSLTFSGETYSAEYKGCWDQPDIIQGVFYLTLQIESQGETEQLYFLEDTYVDDLHCQTGSGLPITAAAGKKVNGVFCVFCETPLDDIEKVEFRLAVYDNTTLSRIEESDVLTVYPNE